MSTRVLVRNDLTGEASLEFKRALYGITALDCSPTLTQIEAIADELSIRHCRVGDSILLGLVDDRPIIVDAFLTKMRDTAHNNLIAMRNARGDGGFAPDIAETLERLNGIVWLHAGGDGLVYTDQTPVLVAEVCPIEFSPYEEISHDSNGSA